MQKLNTFLWFEVAGQAEQAVAFYLSVFPKSKAGKVLRWGDVGPGPKGSVLTADFEIDGHKFTAMNGKSEYKFTPAVSFMIPCETQQEVDYYWDKLLADGGQTMACGWLTDKFGVSWQVTPAALMDMLMDKDQAKANRVMEAMMKMIKLDLPTLKKAYDAS
jgi:predicted 3-demethylubiquinone-9 3-methyltransferase (glyoxalase superfamily)